MSNERVLTSNVAGAFVRTRESALVNGLVWISITLGAFGSVALFTWSVLAAPMRQQSKIDQTRTMLVALREAAELNRSEDNGAGTCPTPRGLMDMREIASGSILVDPWGNPFVIRCEGYETIAVSAGRDGKFGTADDIIAPQPVVR